MSHEHVVGLLLMVIVALVAWVQRERERYREQNRKLALTIMLAEKAMTPRPESEWEMPLTLTDRRDLEPELGQTMLTATRRHVGFGKLATHVWVATDIADPYAMRKLARESAQRSLDRFVVRKLLGLDE